MTKGHAFEAKTVHANTAIFNQGDAAEAVYVVVGGSVEIRTKIDTNTQTIATMRKGDVFGELALIQDRPHSAYAVTLEETEVVEVPRDIFLGQLKKLDPIMRAIIRQLVERLQENATEMEEARQNAPVGKK